MRLIIFYILIFANFISAQSFNSVRLKAEIPDDLPLFQIIYSDNPSADYIFASVPYWGKGNNYLVIYDNTGKPVYFKKNKSTCTDFKLNDNGLLTFFDYTNKKYFAMDSNMTVIDSFWVKNGYETDEHDIKFLRNGNVLLIGRENKIVDMSLFVDGGSKNASVVTNVIQEQDKNKNVLFEWKSYENYKFTDAGTQVNLLDQAFVHAHINSVDEDLDGNFIISSRNLNEITKIDRTTGKIIWRFGGKNNQFLFMGDTTKFNSQHSVNVLINGNLILYDNASYSSASNSRAIEYQLDQTNKVATVVWKYLSVPPFKSLFWGNAQRLKNGNTFIAWGLNDVSASEVTAGGKKVLEIKFPKDVYSYRLFKFPFKPKTTDVYYPNKLPAKYSLEQNFPNPFNPSTEINYSIHEYTHVTLKVYDVLGREVAVLEDEYKHPGFYKSQFSNANYKLNSGIYFYKLHTGKFTETRKMVILK